MADRFTTRMAVFVLLRNAQGELLLQQRANTGYLDSYYDCSASGHVEYGESIQQTAIRELAEETGVTASESDLKLIHINQYFMDAAYVNWVFLLDTWQGDPKIMEPYKCTDMRYFAMDALPEKCVNTLRVAAQAGFSEEVTFSVTNPESYQILMGESLPLLGQ